MTLQVSLEELPHLAQQLWSSAEKSRVVAFHGEMGAGKTTLISAICHYKGVKDAVGSPTFSIINEYLFEEEGKPQKIYHIDLYRLKDEEEVRNAGVEDVIYSGNICFVEWPEKAPFLFDDKTVQVYLEAINEEEREVKIDMPSLV